MAPLDPRLSELGGSFVMRGRDFLRATQGAKGRIGSKTWCVSTIPSLPPCPASHRHSHDLVSSSCIAVGYAIGLRSYLFFFYIFRRDRAWGLERLMVAKKHRIFRGR